MFFSGRTEAMEGLPLACPEPGWRSGTKIQIGLVVQYILDRFRVPVILDPALLDLINYSPAASRDTLQSKVDILYNQPSDLQNQL